MRLPGTGAELASVEVGTVTQADSLVLPADLVGGAIGDRPVGIAA
ncbi:MAG TPA: hypothetical protein VNG12_18875 [Acidimicrobiales bacterium]|nr:hypothetical protein [Acidimicrobiales bacterium]